MKLTSIPLAFFLLLGSCFFNVASGQTIWRIDTMLKTAFDSNPAVNEKRASMHAAEAEVSGAKWQRFPSASLEASSGKSGTQIAKIDQPLWTGGRISSSIQMAENKAQAAEEQIREAELDVALKIIASAVEEIRQERRLKIALASEQAHLKLLEMIQRRVSQDVSSTADLKLASSRLSTAKNEVSLNRQAASKNKIQLSELVGQKVDGVVTEGLPIQPPSESLSSLLQFALERSPTIKRLEHESQAATADIDVKKSAYFPQLIFRLEGVRSHDQTDQRGMLVLNAQPGAGLSAISGVSAAVARKEAIDSSKESAVRALNEQVKQDWYEWTASSGRMNSVLDAKSDAQEVAESYSRQYTAGRKSWLDVLNATREASQAELSVADEESRRLGACLRLHALAGSLVLTPNPN